MFIKTNIKHHDFKCKLPKAIIENIWPQPTGLDWPDFHDKIDSQSLFIQRLKVNTVRTSPFLFWCPYDFYKETKEVANAVQVFFVTFYTPLYAKPDSVFGADNVSEDKIDSVERQEWFVFFCLKVFFYIYFKCYLHTS